MHKSNSTYFTDLDISRGHLLTCLLGNGINKTRLMGVGGNGEWEGSKRFGFALGGVTCHFRRQIRPYEAFEIWTRVLSWDEKWLYLVSHVVKAGSVGDASSYVLQPRKTGDESQRVSEGEKSTHPPIFASSIAKYVFKRGRRTIAPAMVLEQANLLPVPGERYEVDSGASVSGVTRSRGNKGLKVATQDVELKESNTISDASAGLDPKAWSWDWDRVESERSRGMQVAASMAGLNRLDQEFGGGTGKMLGRF